MSELEIYGIYIQKEITTFFNKFLGILQEAYLVGTKQNYFDLPTDEKETLEFIENNNYLLWEVNLWYILYLKEPELFSLIIVTITIQLSIIIENYNNFYMKLY